MLLTRSFIRSTGSRLLSPSDGMSQQSASMQVFLLLLLLQPMVLFDCIHPLSRSPMRSRSLFQSSPRATHTFSTVWIGLTSNNKNDINHNIAGRVNVFCVVQSVASHPKRAFLPSRGDSHPLAHLGPIITFCDLSRIFAN